MIGEHFDDEDKKTDEEKEEGGGAAAGVGVSGAQGRGVGAGGAAAANPMAAALGLGGQGADGGDGDEKDDESKKDIEDYRYFQSIAVMGVALLAMGEDMGSTMALRMFNHFIQYGNTRVKRAVPLALALLCVSNPKLEVSDILSKLSHDHDEPLALNAILALGFIGAGTNNARIAGKH